MRLGVLVYEEEGESDDYRSFQPSSRYLYSAACLAEPKTPDRSMQIDILSTPRLPAFTACQLQPPFEDGGQAGPQMLVNNAIRFGARCLS